MGHATAPLAFTPHKFCLWKHRFDDPRRRFRTLYAAKDPYTCLREILWPFRPNLRAHQEFAEKIRGSRQALAGLVERSYLQERALAQGVLEVASGEIIDLSSMLVRAELERRHAAELRKLGLDYLDLSALRSRSRKLTQFLARALYDQGAAGVLYKSNWDDDGICVALFESRAHISAIQGEPARPLHERMPEVLFVLGEYGVQVKL